MNRKVSYFNPGYIKAGRPAMQCHPCKEMTLREVYEYIISDKARSATENIRNATDKDEQNRLKLLTLSYCTPFGTFSYRKNDNLLEKSGMMVIDIDDIDDNQLSSLKYALPKDSRYQTFLLFTSPRGHGLKWFISSDDVAPEELAGKFREVSRYVQFEYGVIIDESGKDPARCCYLSYDPDCYVFSSYDK